MKILSKLFKQRTAYLFNGERVRYGSKVSFVTSDGQTVNGNIGRRVNGTLYFWNSTAEITDYRNAKLVEY